MKFVLSLLLSLVAGSAYAAIPAVMPIRGCGTNCRVETKQLSKAIKMDKGWAKVLLEEEWIARNSDGVDEVYEGWGGRYWFFANCHDGLAAVGKASDRSDASYFSIYTEGGAPKSSTAAHNVWDRHQILCRAAGYKKFGKTR